MDISVTEHIILVLQVSPDKLQIICSGDVFHIEAEFFIILKSEGCKKNNIHVLPKLEP